MTSRIKSGAAAGTAGFTLIEMIIVLVVLGLVAGIVVSRGPMRSPTVDLRSAATRVLQAMRAARSQAIATDQAEAFTITPDQNSFAVGHSAAQKLPKGVAVSLKVGTQPATTISFMPDGSSTGGVVTLAGTAAGGVTRQMTVTVDWLSGRVRVAEVAP